MGSIADLKRSVVEQLMEAEPFVLVVVDPAAPGVCLPDELMQSATPVGLNIGWQMTIPVPDLKLDEDGISGTLSFNRTPCFCRLPWQAVMQVGVGDEYLVWLLPPPEIDEKPDKKEEEQTSERPRLKLV